MNRAHAWGMAIAWIATVNMGCGGTSTGVAGEAAAAPGTPDSAEGRPGASATTRPPGAAGAPAGMDPGGRSSAAAGSSADTPAGESGRDGSSAGKDAADGGAASGVDDGASGASGSDAGASGAIDGSGGLEEEPTEGAFPTPVESPQIWGFGVGLSDVEAAKEYYYDVMKLEVWKEPFKRDGWTETMLYSGEMDRSARLSLMEFDDERNTRNITTKLIWQVKATAPVDAAASKYPGYVQHLNLGYVMFEGPDTYIHEIATSLDPNGGMYEDPYLVAIGFVVSDAAASRGFYTALGMVDESLGSFPITDATGYGTVSEYSVRYGEGMAIVLQTWSPERNAKDNPVKVVISVPDANAMAEKVVAAGGTIVSPASRSDLYDNRLLIVAKDLDGYMLDLVE